MSHYLLKYVAAKHETLAERLAIPQNVQFQAGQYGQLKLSIILGLRSLLHDSPICVTAHIYLATKLTALRTGSMIAVTAGYLPRSSAQNSTTSSGNLRVPVITS